MRISISFSPEPYCFQWLRSWKNRKIIRRLRLADSVAYRVPDETAGVGRQTEHELALAEAGFLPVARIHNDLEGFLKEQT